MNQTTNYQLSQWDASDRILREDFNADNAKLDAVLAGKLGRVEPIKTVTGGVNTTVITVPLDDVDWDQWSYVGFTFDFRYIGATADNVGTFSCDLNQGQITCYRSQGGGICSVTPGPFMLVFLPLRDKTRKIQAMTWGDPGGYAFGEGTFSEIQTLRITYANYANKRVPDNMQIDLWGIR